MNEQKMSCETEKHRRHMCSLLASGETSEIELLSSNPAVECGVCGAKANSAENVCTPAKVWQEGQIT
jgi:hypothetical protein